MNKSWVRARRQLLSIEQSLEDYDREISILNHKIGNDIAAKVRVETEISALEAALGGGGEIK